MFGVNGDWPWTGLERRGTDRSGTCGLPAWSRAPPTVGVSRPSVDSGVVVVLAEHAGGGADATRRDRRCSSNKEETDARAETSGRQASGYSAIDFDFHCWRRLLCRTFVLISWSLGVYVTRIWLPLQPWTLVDRRRPRLSATHKSSFRYTLYLLPTFATVSIHHIVQLICTIWNTLHVGKLLINLLINRTCMPIQFGKYVVGIMVI